MSDARERILAALPPAPASGNRQAESLVLPPPAEPMAVARAFVASRYTHESGTLLLRHWRGGWWSWQRTHWAEVEHGAVREAAYRFTENAQFSKTTKDGTELADWAPNRHKVADLLEALAAVCRLPDATTQPAWTDGERQGVFVSCENGLLDVESRALYPHSPAFFNQTSVSFGYDPEALEPTRWLGFLDQLWGDDTESIAALQEFMGYVVSGRLDLDTILLAVGPTRAGKGAIARVLTALVGADNVCGPTLSSLGSDFGLAPLLGKSLAVISDARLNGRDSSVVVERLLAISGRDTITVNRKYRDQWTGQLPTRFLVISNELPHLGDASHAIVGRLLVLQLCRSWLGNEDRGLEASLHQELAGVLSWALDGLDRLLEQGRFTRPKAMDDAILALEDLASPVAAFVRDRCARGPGLEVDADDLWKAWRAWAEDNGQKPGTRQTLGRNLRAVVPSLRVVRPKQDGARWRRYQGLALTRSDNG